MPIDALLLDLGNVLVFHDNALLLRRFAERAGLDEQEATSRFDDAFWLAVNRGELAGPALAGEMASRLETTLPYEDFQALWSCHFTVNHAFVPYVERLAKRLPLVLVSNTNALHYDYLEPLLPVLKDFHTKVLSHELGLAKPDPAFFRHALAQVNVPAERAAYFDDLVSYVDAACALGIHGRVFTTTEAALVDIEALGLLT